MAAGAVSTKPVGILPRRCGFLTSVPRADDRHRTHLKIANAGLIGGDS
jgi:hypothetical protein